MAIPRCEMYVEHMDGPTECGDRSRYRLERADGDAVEGWSPAETCARHLPEMLFDLASGDEVAITVTLHYDEPGERTEGEKPDD
jgi:hypothetical protein